jgi:arginyl-tRNA synthetase
MILPVHHRLRAHVAHLLTTLYALDEHLSPAIVLDYPPNRDLGDLGTPVAFELARRLRKAPRAILEIAGAFGSLEASAGGSGASSCLNFFLQRRGFFSSSRPGRQRGRPTAGKAIVERTAIDRTRRRVGHLRNSALGDARSCAALPRRSVRSNYIDDTGVQVADVVVGFRMLEGKSLDRFATSPHDAVRLPAGISMPASPSGKGDKELLRRAQALHDIEHGGKRTPKSPPSSPSDRPLP